MDISTMIVDMLRKGKDERVMAPFPRGPERPSAHAEVSAAGATELAVPGYAAYRREAEANGEPVMSPAEFKKFQAQGN